MKHTLHAILNRKNFILQALLPLTIWLTYKPYEGLIGDANLYMAQALTVLGFDLSSDLFFEGGSQAEFSLFPLLHAGLLSVLGVEIGQGFLYLLSSLLWLAGLWSLAAKSNLVPWARVVAVLCICLAGVRYSVVIGAAEQFFTARLLAEALSLFSLVFLLKGHLTSGLLTGLLAVLLHPLHGIWGVAVGVGYLLGLRCTAILAIAGILFCAFGLDVIVAKEWFSHRLLTLVTEQEVAFHAWRSPWLIAEQWEWNDGFRFATLLLMIFLGVVSKSAVYRRLATVSVVIISAALTVFWMTALDAERVRLILALQLWRGQWFLQVMAAMGLALYLTTCRDRLVKLTVFLACILSAWISYISGFFFIALLVLIHFYGSRYLRPMLLRSLWWSFLVLEIFLLIVARQFGPISYGVGDESLFWQDVWRFAAMLVFIYILFLRSFSFGRGVQRAFGWGGAGLLMAGAILLWDMRTEDIKKLEKSIRLDVSGDSILPFDKDDDLLWLDMGVGGYQMPHASWFLLKRPNFISDPQMAGSIFNGHTYRVGSERLNRLVDASLVDVTKEPSRSYQTKWISYATMAPDEQKSLVGQLCRAGVDVLMSKRPLYKFHGEINVQGDTYYYFKCAKERESVHS